MPAKGGQTVLRTKVEAHLKSNLEIGLESERNLLNQAGVLYGRGIRKN